MEAKKAIILLTLCLGLFTLLSCFPSPGPTGVVRTNYVQTKSGTKKIIYYQERYILDPNAIDPNDRYATKTYYMHVDASGVTHKFDSWDQAKESIIGLYGEPEGGGGEGCFTADTLVLLENTLKPISEVVDGDVVHTYSENGQHSLNPVIKAYIYDSDHYYVINGKIKVTRRHRFQTDAGWKRVYELQPGDMLMKSDGSYEKLVSKEKIMAKLKVYSLDIADNHNFFVSADGKEGFLVHNHGGGAK